MYLRSSAIELSAHFAATESTEISPPEASLIKSTSNLTAAAGICFSVSSASTPSAPILSILSKVIQTESRVSEAKPIFSSMARRIRRSLILIQKSLKPILIRARAVTSISSTSALHEESPRISISH